MLDLVLDRRSTARWGALEPLLTPLATDDLVPRPPRFVWRWICQHCERHYIGTAHTRQPCPACGRALALVGTWDLRTERAPRWWADPGERP
jgi:hypothetical protein